MTGHPLVRALGHLAIAVVFAAILALTSGGELRPLDNALRDIRFAAMPRSTSGSVVFVDIDSRSLSSVGVWPWPRHVHAQILDALMALGANDVAFDIDFSVASSATEDTAFAYALQRAGGYAYLAAFRQQRVGGRAADYNLPLAQFDALANPVSVNVSLDADGVVRSYPFGLTIGDEAVPSVASIFTGVSAPAGTAFSIDYSIDPRGVDRISAADLLAGKVAPERVAGKNVVIGASAVELRDYFVVPRFGAIPGALLQALATESLRQNRALQPASPAPALAAILLIGALTLLARRRLAVGAAIGGAVLLSGATEVLALGLQDNAGLLLDTAGVHLASVGLVLAVFASELVRRGEQRRKATAERDAVRRMLDRVITDNFDGVVIADGDGRIVAASQFAEELLDRRLQGEVAAQTLPDRFAGLLRAALDGRGEQGELTLKLGESERILEFVVTHSTVEVGPSSQPVACLTFRDISARRRAEERLRYLGGHDPLTGAVSRTHLVEQIEAAFAAGNDIGVVIVDLRRFRIINDSLGHGQGDLLLKQVVSRLRSMGPDQVARLGGDSFALMTPAMTADKLEGFGQAVVQWLAFPYQLADAHQAIIAASAGATNSHVSGRNAEVLLSHADMALSAAKQRSSAGVAVFTPDMDDRLRERQAMDAALRQALARREFSLAYQPQVDLADGQVVGAEALARWTHPTLGPISPSRFIPAAEETGLIVELGRWALGTACLEAMRWPEPIRIAVNLSPVQFELSDVAADVRAALEKSGLAPERLELEITEGVFVRDFEAVTAKLGDIRALGVGIALDDFGTGYSSLSYLGQLPIDKIKIDQSFVRRLPADAESAAIIQAVVTLAASLRKGIIAEGIETADQAWMLRMIGCAFGQGYHFDRPLAPNVFAIRLSERRLALASTA